MLHLSKILPGTAVAVILPPVDLAGRDPITEHLRHIAVGHAAADQAVRILEIIIHPVLEVMLVPSLVMQPGGRDARRQSLHPVRALGSLVVADAGPKLRRAVL